MSNMTITQFILKLRVQYLDKPGVRDFEDINSGLCCDFADDVCSEIVEAKRFWGDELTEDDWGMDEKWMNSYSYGHAFIKYNGKYYDSESPWGVKHPIKLKYYQRELQFSQKSK